jgi:ribosomal protein L37AE/L43A
VPKISPPKLRPYLFHGLDLQWEEGAKQANGECPFCGKKKFTVEIETGLYRCLVCAEGAEKGGGNEYVFIRKLWEKSYESTTDYSELSVSRKLLDPLTLMNWKLAKSIITREWLVPGFNKDGKMSTLYVYRKGEGGKYSLRVTTNLHHGIHRYDFKGKQGSVILCEGFWDAVALHEILGITKRDSEGGLTRTAYLSSSHNLVFGE